MKMQLFLITQALNSLSSSQPCLKPLKAFALLFCPSAKLLKSVGIISGIC